MYHEVTAQLIFLAYLTRIVNGGGFADPGHDVGRGRMDIMVRKPYTGPDGKPAVQREAIELKVRTERLAPHSGPVVWFIRITRRTLIPIQTFWRHIPSSEGIAWFRCLKCREVVPE